MNLHSDDEKRNRQFLVRYLTLLVVVGVAGSVVVRIMMHERRSKRLLEAARDAGYPTSYAELAEYTRLPEGVENAADLYMRASAVYVPPADEVNLPVAGRAELPDRGKPMPEPMANAAADFLAANGECLSLLREAARIEHCRYDWDYADGEKRFPQSDGLKACARLLELAAIIRAQQGDSEAALRCVEDGLRLGESLRREPRIIGHLLRIAFDAAALTGLERTLNTTVFSDSQLRHLQGVLGTIADGLDFARVMVTEQCFMIESCREPLRRKEPRGLRALPGYLSDQGIGDTLAFGYDYIEASRLPPAARLARVRALDKDLADLSFWHTFVKITMPAMSRTVELDIRFRAELDLAQLSLAIERYRLATGEVPERLEVLVPQYLDAVPLDPFDGRLIRYRRTEPGYRLYSIMEDGQDNGGRTRDEVSRGVPYGSCFIVTR